MLNTIIKFSINNKLIIGLFTLGLIVFGIYNVTKLPIDAVPDITDNQVQIITAAPSLAAPEIERLITFPIEQCNNNIPGIKEIRSFSRFGLSVVTIVFDDATDLYWARQQVSERLQIAQEQIPKGFGIPKLGPVTTGLGEIYQYTIRAKKGYEEKYNAMELRTIQDWMVRRQLLSVQGVAEVSSLGGYLKQYEIAIDPEKLNAHQITMSDIFHALETNNQNTGGAYIERGPTVLFIRSEGLVENMESIQEICVKNLKDGTPVLIRDIAEVRLGNAIRYGAMTYNGKEEVAGAVVMMLKGANSNEVIQNIKTRIEKIQKTLPEGVVIEPFLDRTKMVDNSIHTVSKNLMEGALIVILVLVLFLGNLRAGLLVASVIPLAMLFAIIMMNIFGVSGNLMSLGALDFGLIVDGAVIIVEAIMHRLSHSKQFSNIQRLSQDDMDKEVQFSTSRMMNSAVFGQIIILIVYLPIFALEGIEGKMFKPMAQTVAFALIGAFILSLTYVPMMSSLIISKKISQSKTFSDRWMEKIQRSYQFLLSKALSIPKTIIGLVLVLFLGAIVLITRLGGEFIPSLPEGDYAVETRVLPGSNLSTSMDAISKASKLLMQRFPEIEKIVGKTGSGEVPTDPMPIDASDMMIILKDKTQWTSAKTYDELEAKMAEELEAVPGVSFGFQYPVAMRFNELISGARQDVVCKIFGEDLDTLAVYAKKLGDICSKVEGSSGLYVESVTGMPQIVIQYDRPTIAEYGLSISDVNQVVNSAFAGQTSGLVYEGEKRFDLVVRLASKKRQSLTDVQNLLIPTSNGQQIPLYQVAKVEIQEGPNQIQRENAHRRIMVGFNIRGRDVESMVRELQQRVEEQLKLPVGYYISYGGAFENLEAAKNRLAVAVPVSLLLIFIMLYFAFSSIKQGLLIYSAIPLSAIGGILALALREIPFSISAGIGFIALFGVAVLNGIVLVSEFNRLKNEGIHDLRKIVIQGTRIRLRPVLMTALVASIGFLPMAISTGEGSEVQRPLATVVIGGLMVATFLTLFVLPILYIMFEKSTSLKTSIQTNLVLVLLLFFNLSTATNTKGQNTIQLKAAIDSAKENNLLIKHERLKTERKKILIETSSNIPATIVSGEYGKFNSFYSDTKIGISQALSFPKVYSSQKTMLQEEWKTSVQGLSIREIDLKKQVTKMYYQLIYLEMKKQLLQKSDSLFSEFLEKANARLAAGEGNILEKSSAEQQLGQIRLQMKQLQKDMEISILEFQLLLNCKKTYLPIVQDFKIKMISFSDSMNFRNHPKLKQLQQSQLLASAETQVEKSKLLPEINLSYNLMSMQGTGADNKIYEKSLQFQSFQVGLGIPLFRKQQKARIQAAILNEQLASNELNHQNVLLKNELDIALNNYEKHETAVRFFEDISLANAELINNTAHLQFKKGAIHFLEWALLIQQSIIIQNEYLDALNERNNSIIDINYIINK